MATYSTETPQPALKMRQIFKTWWPLAASWLLMSIELPGISAVMARLADPEISLAAYGGIVFPLALLIEAPVIMLLAASTALSKDWASYTKIRRFMMVSGFVLTILHLVIVLTPLYYLVAEGMLGAPAEIIEPARTGLLIMLPWTWAIAYRRFNQGVLIRFDHSRAVGVGTVIRLASNWLVLALGYYLKLPGIIVGTAAVAVGVTAEAIYVGIVIRPIIRNELKPAQDVEPQLTFSKFSAFYVPLVMTSLLTMLAQPMGSAALSRMPENISSLAVWPIIGGLSFIFRSPGVAYNEVVVALLGKPGGPQPLRRFTAYLSTVSASLLLLMAVTPLAYLWLNRVSALSDQLTELALPAVWIMIPLPIFATVQSWYQGILLNEGHTSPITEAIVVYLVVYAVVLAIGIQDYTVSGLYVGLSGIALSMFAQTGWLWFRSRKTVKALPVVLGES